jgi:hypothetical protein
MTFDGLILPVHNHRLGALATVHSEIENRVVTALRVQNAQHMPRIHAHRLRIFAGAINHGGDFAFAPHPPGMILGPRLARLRFQNILFQSSRHDFFSF